MEDEKQKVEFGVIHKVPAYNSQTQPTEKVWKLKAERVSHATAFNE